MSERIYLVIMNGWNPNKAGGAGADACYFGTKGFISKSTDVPADTVFLPLVNNPGLFSQSMFSTGATGGSSSGGGGVIKLLNTTGDLDNLIDWGFDGFTSQILEGPLDGALADFGVVMSGTIEQLVHAWTSVSGRFRDRTTLLDKPVALNYYLGNNAPPLGVEGGVELKNKPKPRLFGTEFNFTPELVNSAKLIYQANDGALIAVTGVRDGTVALTFGANYVDVAGLMAASTLPGTYDTCLAYGYIRLGAPVVFEITMGATADSLSLGQGIRALAIEKLGSKSIVEQSIIDLDKVLPASVIWHYYTGTKTVTTKAVLDDLARAGLWWGFDNNGLFWVRQFAAPVAANAICTLDNNNEIGIERLATTDSDKGVPIWRVVCRYRHNAAVQPATSAPGVIGVYDQEWLEAVYQDPNDGTPTGIRTIHPLAEELVIDTPYSDYAAALAEATRQFNLRSVRRDRLKVTLPLQVDGPLSYPVGGYWDDLAIAEMPATRYNHCSVIYGNYLYVIGGVIAGAVSQSVMRLDLSNPTGTWDDAGVTNLPYSIAEGVAFIYNGKLYVSGGRLTLGSSYSTETISLDLAAPTGAWNRNAITATTWAYHGHAAAVNGSTLIMVGGYFHTVSSPVNTVNLFDLSNPGGAWSTGTVYPISAAAIKLQIANGILYGVGGLKSGGVVSAATYGIAVANLSGSWDTALIPDLPGNRHGVAFEAIGNALYLIGGVINTIIAASSCYKWIIGDASWIQLSNLPVAKGYIGSGVFNKAIYITGGWTTNTVPLANSYRYRHNDNPADLAELRSLGRTLLVKSDRYGYTTGRPMSIIGMEPNFSERQMILDLWG